MDRLTLLNLGWQLSQDLSRLLTAQLHDHKAVEQKQIDDIQNHLDVVELLLQAQANNWRA